MFSGSFGCQKLLLQMFLMKLRDKRVVQLVSVLCLSRKTGFQCSSILNVCPEPGGRVQ